MGQHPFTVIAVVQRGRLENEALLLAGSVRVVDPDRRYRLVLAEPQPGPMWPADPRISAAHREVLSDLGADIVPFVSRHFGAAYPYGNKIEALAALAANEAFLFLDTDTLVTGRLDQVPFDFSCPGASLRRTGTWPKGDRIDVVWRALYDRFGLDFETSQDRAFGAQDWRRYLYFNAGAFWYRDAAAFGARFREIACAIRDDTPAALAGQSLDPWLDQVALPLVIHGLGGGRAALAPGWIDGQATCHWRYLALLYARETARAVDVLEAVAGRGRIKKLLKAYAPAHALIYRGDGRKVREKYFGADLDEQALRKALKADGVFLR